MQKKKNFLQQIVTEQADFTESKAISIKCKDFQIKGEKGKFQNVTDKVQIEIRQIRKISGKLSYKEHHSH